jgi:hypothetical protein
MLLVLDLGDPAESHVRDGFAAIVGKCKNKRCFSIIHHDAEMFGFNIIRGSFGLDAACFFISRVRILLRDVLSTSCSFAKFSKSRFSNEVFYFFIVGNWIFNYFCLILEHLDVGNRVTALGGVNWCLPETTQNTNMENENQDGNDNDNGFYISNNICVDFAIAALIFFSWLTTLLIGVLIPMPIGARLAVIFLGWIPLSIIYVILFGILLSPFIYCYSHAHPTEPLREIP